MGCQGSESNKPGKCPVCEMDLVANQATPATE
ncbi:heavy metal-binding domain-containing protein [Hymenobacter sp. NBH84]